MPIFQMKELRLQDTKKLLYSVWTMIGRMVPWDIHALILRTYEYVMLHDKEDFADVIQVTNLKTWRLS